MKKFQNWMVLFLCPVLVVGAYYGYLHESGNFHTVVGNQAYRSRQLDHWELIHYISSYKIRSILNLRGMNTGAEWYEDEVRASHELDVLHYDLEMSANRELSNEELSAIVVIMHDAPKPILIHCRSGADRTGLIAAVYQYTMDHQKAEKASAQLSILYGHFPFFGNSTAAMDRTFWRYVSTHAN